MEDTVKKGDSA